jgi:hypothetical protein
MCPTNVREFICYPVKSYRLSSSNIKDIVWRESDVISTIMRTLVASPTSAPTPETSATVTTPATTPAATPATAPAPAPAPATSPSPVPSSALTPARAQTITTMLAPPSRVSVLTPVSHVIPSDLDHLVPTLPSASLSLNDSEALPDDLWSHLGAESENIQDQNRAVEYSEIGAFDLNMEYVVDSYTNPQSGPASSYNSWPT